MKTYFLHGKSKRPDGTFDTFWTREVEAKEAPMPHHLAGLSWTASGYGAAIPTRTMIKFNGRWRRVYCRIYSNVGTCYIRSAAPEIITVQEHDA